jgi:hypothetical protein
MLAHLSAVCPLCDRFITEGRNSITNLPKAIPPLTFDGRRNFEAGPYYADGRALIDLRPRKWVHVACAQTAAATIARFRAAALTWQPAGSSAGRHAADLRPSILPYL